MSIHLHVNLTRFGVTKEIHIFKGSCGKKIYSEFELCYPMGWNPELQKGERVECQDCPLSTL